MTMWRCTMAVTGRRRFAAVVSMSFMAALVLSIPVSATEKEDLERLIERTNTKRSTPEKVSEFVSKLMDYYYIGNPVVEGLLKEFKPGEVLTIIAISTHRRPTAMAARTVAAALKSCFPASFSRPSSPMSFWVHPPHPM